MAGAKTLRQILTPVDVGEEGHSSCDDNGYSTKSSLMVAKVHGVNKTTKMLR